MSEYKYEKVEGITVGHVVDAMCNGDKFYVKKDGEFVIFDTDTISDALFRVGMNELYTRKETPWWEGCEGGVIMAKNYADEKWMQRIFSRFDEEDEQFVCINQYYNQARPLTTTERDAIKVQD